MRPIWQIAAEISRDWKDTSKSGIYFAAVPHLEAMYFVSEPTDTYGVESAKSIVNYFLASASTYRGAKARELKAELKKIIGAK